MHYRYNNVIKAIELRFTHLNFKAVNRKLQRLKNGLKLYKHLKRIQQHANK